MGGQRQYQKCSRRNAKRAQFAYRKPLKIVQAERRQTMKTMSKPRLVSPQHATDDAAKKSTDRVGSAPGRAGADIEGCATQLTDNYAEPNRRLGLLKRCSFLMRARSDCRPPSLWML